MAKYVFKGGYVSINSVDLTNWAREVELTLSGDEVEATTLGSGGYQEVEAGLKRWSARVKFAQDFGSSAVDETLRSLVGTKVACAFRPQAGAKSTTNPEYAGTMLVREYPPISGAVGDLLETELQLVGSGNWTISTS